MITVWRMTGGRVPRRRWLPDRVSVGALTRAFPPGLVDRVVATDARERRRLLPARQRRRTGCRAGYRLSESPPVLTGTNLDEELRSLTCSGKLTRFSARGTC